MGQQQRYGSYCRSWQLITSSLQLRRPHNVSLDSQHDSQVTAANLQRPPSCCCLPMRQAVALRLVDCRRKLSIQDAQVGPVRLNEYSEARLLLHANVAAVA